MLREGEVRLTEVELRNAIKREFTQFIQNWKENGEPKYINAARNAINNSSHHIVFSFRDLLHHNNELAKAIFDEYYKW